MEWEDGYIDMWIVGVLCTWKLGSGCLGGWLVEDYLPKIGLGRKYIRLKVLLRLAVALLQYEEDIYSLDGV